MQIKLSLGIFSGSYSPSDKSLISSLTRIGDGLDTKKFEIIYGGGDMGTMGIIPKSFHKNGGRVKGFTIRNITNGDTPWEKIEYENIYKRQTELISNADILLFCPGGTGTLFELSEILVLNSMNVMNKPIFLFDYKGFFKPIVEYLKQSYNFNFISDLGKLQLRSIENDYKLIKEVNSVPFLE